ncbi:MAG TPA: hypothetical protein VNN80_16010, partial [Polyangiaceae bacterium]|nr:hypothetical protein [Polyangiaceae bacterium]
PWAVRRARPITWGLLLLCGGLVGCRLDERETSVIAPESSAASPLMPASDAVASDGSMTAAAEAEGLAGSNESRDLASGSTEGVTLVSSALSLGQGCSAESAPCDATLSCVDGRCRLPCAGADDCAGLGEGVTCAVGVALSGMGVGACTYAVYCDPVHPSAPVAGAEPCSAGEGCAPSASGSSACQPQPGSSEFGGACLEDVNCAPGLFCGEYGTCRRYCLDDADCGSGVCSPFVPARRAGDLSVGFCATSAQCDPAHPHSPRDGASTCAVDAGCAPSELPDGEGGCVARNPSGGARYDACSTGADCQPGLFCGTGDLAGICNAYCATDDDCPEGHCAEFSTPEFALGASVGFCAAICNPGAPYSSGGGLSACPSGLRCAPRYDGASFCRIALGRQGPYEACDSTLLCAPGLFCNDNGFCRPYCLSDAECGAGRCDSFDDGRSAGETPVGGCAEICNPVAPSVSDDTFNSCPQGFRCSGRSNGMSLCFRAGTGGYGTPCEANVACAPGFYCGTSTCRKYCFDASDCESGECNPLGTPTFAADRLLGFCTDP